MSEIRKWLEGIGLVQYADIFESNDLDIDLLRQVDDQILKDIGIFSAGHRLRIRSAIAKLSSEATLGKDEHASDAANRPPVADVEIRQPRPSAVAGATPVSPAAEVAGERRYLTVMFCDLVGSTGISAQLDAEEWRDLVGAYLDAASAAVVQMGGHVAKKLGDGLLALFGYPLAHENDAERAVRAALSIQRALADLNRRNFGGGKPELAARIGLESGAAVLDAAGEIYGDVANIAARVQTLAEPGSVLATAGVQRQIAGLFVAEQCGTHALKGVPEPIALFRLMRASGAGRRSSQRQPTPLVGRDEEMAMLTRRWERARQGDGQLVLIVGEPGLGKSRLVEEFHIRLNETPHTWSEWSCSQLLQNTPLHPIAEWGRQRFGGLEVPSERRLADLESTLALVKLDPAENVPLLAPLLEIPLPKDQVPNVAPEEMRRRQLAALSNWVIAGAKNQPLVLVFEDVHWADPTTLDVLRGLAERGALAPLLVVATTRPEFRPPWGIRSHHSTISLAPLDRSQVRDMVAELSARRALPGNLVDDVVSRTGGVPLFVEEVTRLLLERGDQGAMQAIPPTLQQSLMARLDRLGPAREVAQVGSVIGRGFSYELLRAVAEMDEARLQAALDRLAESDIVLVQGLPPRSDYRFKHALIQDAAYENLLKSRRQVLHRRVAEILRDRFASTGGAEPEVLAHHFTQAGMTDAAIEWWGKAGDQGLRRSAFQEAISHLGKAIEMADKADESASRGAAKRATGERLKLQTTYSQALSWAKGYAAPETAAAFARARDLAASDDNPAERFATLYGQWSVSILRAELASARQLAEILFADAEKAARPPEMAVGRRIAALTCFLHGAFEEAQNNAEEALKIYDPEWDADTKFRTNHDTGATATIYLALTSWIFGDAARAQTLANEATSRALDCNHVPTATTTGFFKVLFETISNRADGTATDAKALIRVTRDHATPMFLSLAIIFQGWARARLGELDAGLTDLCEGLTSYARQGNQTFLPLIWGLRAGIEAESGSAEGALTRIDEALTLAAETGEHWTDFFLHRVRGEVLLKRNPPHAAFAEQFPHRHCHRAAAEGEEL